MEVRHASLDMDDGEMERARSGNANLGSWMDMGRDEGGGEM